MQARRWSSSGARIPCPQVRGRLRSFEHRPQVLEDAVLLHAPRRAEPVEEKRQVDDVLRRDGRQPRAKHLAGGLSHRLDPVVQAHEQEGNVAGVAHRSEAPHRFLANVPAGMAAGEAKQHARVLGAVELREGQPLQVHPSADGQGLPPADRSKRLIEPRQHRRRDDVDEPGDRGRNRPRRVRAVVQGQADEPRKRRPFAGGHDPGQGGIPPRIDPAPRPWKDPRSRELVHLADDAHRLR
jgi:hypothetical protein